MKLELLQPLPELQPYVDAFWLFESALGVPVADNRVIAPNGKAKIIVPYRNALCTTVDSLLTEYPEQDLYFIGIWDKPVVLSSPARATGTIGMELSPSGLHRFLRVPLHELTNRIFSFPELFGAAGRTLQQQIGNTDSPEQKVQLLQAFLVAQLQANERHNSLIDYSVNLISSTAGLVEVKELERKTGYSRRYLNLLFKEHLGISPKTLSGIVRFQEFYRLWANTEAADFFKDHLHERYYDQSHFIKEFKRFTGYSPRQYALARNEFGKIFYKV